jgi:pseudaminic acid biosynthesis-associated methylase
MNKARRGSTGEAERLELIWHGCFGDAYVERNAGPDQRAPFWRQFLDRYPIQRVLEVGCNVGGNLQWIVEKVPSRQVFGIDVNEKALSILRSRLQVNATWSLARDLPFRDACFDLVFTAGVLIHQPEQSLGDVISEVVRCSSRYVLCMEYFAEQTVEVPYRGQAGALFRRDYGRIYAKTFPKLILLERGFLGKDQGWDDVTWWLFEKKR